MERIHNSSYFTCSLIHSTYMLEKKYAYCQPSVVTAVTTAVTRIHFQDKLISWYYIRSNEGLRERTEYVLQL